MAVHPSPAAAQIQRLLRRRWLVWAVLAFCFAIAFFHRVSLAVVSDQLMAEFNLGAAALGNLGAIYFYIYTIMQIPSGLLADTSGPRLTVSLGMLLAAAGAALFALAPNLAIAGAGRFLTGLGVSVIFVCVQKAQTSWFRPGEFATLTGLTSSVGNAGALCAATPLALLVAAVGWRSSFLVVAALGLVGAVACWLLVRDRPQDLGLPSLAELEAYLTDAEPPAAAPQLKISLREALTPVLKNRYLIPVLVAAFGLNGTLQTFISMWGIPYVMQVYRLGRTQASAFTLLTGLGTIISGPLFGLISDRLRRRKPVLFTFIALPLAGWSMLVFWPSPIPLALLRLIYFAIGLGAGGFLTVMVLAKEVNPPAIAGLATGTANTAAFLGAALLQPLVGFILDYTWDGTLAAGVPVYSLTNFRWGFSICLLTMVISCAVCLRLPETGARHLLSDDCLATPPGLDART
ncbi:MAG: MFS transporter [Firmicutes bacterium]|nr:MFS transporter [Bacillota bacterium]